jgi:hypothetical protein
VERTHKIRSSVDIVGFPKTQSKIQVKKIDEIPNIVYSLPPRTAYDVAFGRRLRWFSKIFQKPLKLK